MRGGTVGRLLATTAAVAVLASLGGCGDDDPQGATTPAGSSETSAMEAQRVPDPGDALLQAARRGAVFEGTGTEVSWRFPESYVTAGPRQASSREGGATFDLIVGAKPGVDPQTEAERLRDEEPASEVTRLVVDDLEVTVVSRDAEGGTGSSLRTHLFSPPGAEATYALLFYASTSLDDTPQQRLDEVAQVLGSVELEVRGEGS